MKLQSDYNAALMAITEGDLGIAEWPGAKHNPQILAMFERVGHGNIRDDETAWCAAYVGSKLAQVGIPHTGKLTARSYETWGHPVGISHAMPGDVVVLWRGSPDSWQGHVGFFVRFEGDKVVLRGGNQGNKVSDAAYPMNRIVSVRRWLGNTVVEPNGRPKLVMGNKTPDPFVKVLQSMLAENGYFSGAQDGLFGPRTRASVLAFQADHGLTVDGIVGPQTWEALSHKAEPRPERDISKDDLVASGSRTIKVTQNGKRTAEVVTAGGVLGTVVANSEKIGPALDTTTTFLDKAQAIVLAYWPLLLVIGAGFAVWWYFNKIEAYRVDDARTGANDRI